VPFHLISLGSNLLFSHLCLGLPSCHFLSEILIKSLFAFVLLYTRHMPHPSNSRFHRPNNIWWKVKGKGFPLQAWSGSWGSRRLRLLDRLDIWHYEGGKVVTLMHRPSLPTGVFLVLIFRGWVDPRAHGSVSSFGKNSQWHHRGSIQTFRLSAVLWWGVQVIKFAIRLKLPH
jgi:hypothetical protein